jgi:hypothetical protein
MAATQRGLLFSCLKLLAAVPLLLIFLASGCLNPTAKHVTQICVINDTDYQLWLYLPQIDTIHLYAHKIGQIDVKPGEYIHTGLMMQGVNSFTLGPDTEYVAPGEIDTILYYY